ncbi:hypothetical protein D3C73_529190 [compost metagenome]
MSDTVCAIGPAVSRVCEIGVILSCEYLPTVGRKPTQPFKALGNLIEAPVSVPIAIGTIPAATATALPEEDPPAICNGFTAFRVPTTPSICMAVL